MKKLVTIIFFMASIYGYSAANLKEVNQTLEIIQVNDFIKNIEKIKSFKSVEDVDEVDFKLKSFFKNIKFWYYFDHEDYKRKLVSKLGQAFKGSELKKINRLLSSKPFIVKILSETILHRDLFAYNKESVDEVYRVPEIAKSRYALMENIYILFGMEIQKDLLDKRLAEIIRQGKVLLKVLDKDAANQVYVNPINLQKRIKLTKEFIIKHFAQSFATYRHYEVRELIRTSKKSKNLQKFIQVYANFNFIYMTNYIQKVEDDKLNQLKTIKISK